MLTEEEILWAVRQKIKGIYPKHPIHLKDSKKNFRVPCFFLKMIRSTAKAGKRTTYNVCTLYVTYFPRWPVDPEELYSVKDVVVEAFWNGLQVAGRAIKFGTLSTNTIGQDGDVAEITLPFTYYDSLGQDENEKWLVQNINIYKQTNKYEG